MPGAHSIRGSLVLYACPFNNITLKLPPLSYIIETALYEFAWLAGFSYIPPQTEHGFVVLSEEAVIEVIGEQHVGSYVKILNPDGSSYEVEVFSKEILADHEPPEGTAHTPFADMLKMMEPTKRLL
jgi:hypothetical protein